MLSGGSDKATLSTTTSCKLLQVGGGGEGGAGVVLCNDGKIQNYT